jgi:hypothetical protein
MAARESGVLIEFLAECFFRNVAESRTAFDLLKIKVIGDDAKYECSEYFRGTSPVSCSIESARS